MSDSTAPRPAPLRDVQAMLEATRRQWGGRRDLWVFAYASLIWRPEFDFAEQRWAQVHGYHRSLKMWSRINRGTPECPGLVFALLQGGSCKGVAYRIDRRHADQALERLWLREMPTGVYDPRWLSCHTERGKVQALAFTLSRRSHPQFTTTSSINRVRSSSRGRQCSSRTSSTSLRRLKKGGWRSQTLHL